MELSGRTVQPGAPVWALERDGSGRATGFFGNVFLAEVSGYVLMTPKRFGIRDDDLDDLLEELSRNTWSVRVCRKADCFVTRDEVQTTYELLRRRGK